jgi:hypothetical protein
MIHPQLAIRMLSFLALTSSSLLFGHARALDSWDPHEQARRLLNPVRATSPTARLASGARRAERIGDPQDLARQLIAGGRNQADQAMTEKRVSRGVSVAHEDPQSQAQRMILGAQSISPMRTALSPPSRKSVAGSPR